MFLEWEGMYMVFNYINGLQAKVCRYVRGMHTCDIPAFGVCKRGKAA